MFSIAAKFFGVRTREADQPTNSSSISPGRIQPLTAMETYQDLTVVRIKLPEKELNRLSELGLRQGSMIRVLQASPDGALLVAVGDGRIGLNYDTAQKIYVY